jgi:1-pyrroline-4-hydroxy-2-carboxylate deaminase
MALKTNWTGVFPALTTKFKKNGDLDFVLQEKHYRMQLESGVHGFVVLGSLGENGTLTADEKQEIVKLAVATSSHKVPVLATVAETTTARACKFVEHATINGVDGFMVLPGMQYVSDRRETIQHFRAVASASSKPIMLYNNPVAYRVDTTPEMFAELANEPKFVAIKESSEDVRRIGDIRNLVGDRYQIFIGVDDLAMESMLLGAVGWVAGLVCAFPKETVVLYELIKAKRIPEALELYRWFLPLLHLDTAVKFVQYIKFAETMVGCGTEFVRAPRLQLTGDERKKIESIIRIALKRRPVLPKI